MTAISYTACGVGLIDTIVQLRALTELLMLYFTHQQQDEAARMMKILDTELKALSDVTDSLWDTVGRLQVQVDQQNARLQEIEQSGRCDGSESRADGRSVVGAPLSSELGLDGHSIFGQSGTYDAFRGDAGRHGAMAESSLSSRSPTTSPTPLASGPSADGGVSVSLPSTPQPDSTESTLTAGSPSLLRLARRKFERWDPTRRWTGRIDWAPVSLRRIGKLSVPRRIAYSKVTLGLLRLIGASPVGGEPGEVKM